MDRRTLLAAAALACAASLPAFAQDAASFPNKPIRIVVNFPPGGSLDVITRTVGQKLSEKFGQPVLVENRTGAGGNIGAQAVATAAPDGYTLLSSPPGPLTINQFLYREMPFDPLRLVPVGMLSSMPNVITARPGLPANNVRELIEYARSNPGKVTYGSQGNGSTSHLTAQMFATMAGVQMVHVPFRGEGPALTELLGGRIDLFFGNTASVMKYMESKQVKLLGVAAAKRSSMVPDVPAGTEFGLPDFVASAWFGMVAPPGTPAPVVQKLNAAINEVLRMPEVRERFAAQGAEVVGGSPAEMTSFLEAERARWKKVIDSANVKLD
ncbi:Bug family tripartite tricarboxylate transporter substrate binding protein [Ramlibacter rhizophilus]|uniref:Tripartite tricarboxylate transporter substrate binding protein n=1 Tax=Ramlibacter rhizophilus TaxID=1781167 RepID=A0A4Z0BNJ4_9BURK|nr:tripartite tricarboxylate transporter substrate binding protein [Ramlibacter rhizophilus]TFY99827.1 tripartite tricarboxylate transporter substrate binding protein [Ramlibacter rhizophilus]